ncbi:MAG: hypothetical protein FJZ80_01375 [Bacteroidetes bacterium]|nr:hypothetical protein [Bacteroidota bacterium]MBM3424266.1 hypothetical protein [Bacteroidota bacterium]
MEKSVKIALTGFLVALAFTLSYYLEVGSWIVPYPLFSFLLLIVIIFQLIAYKNIYLNYLPLLFLAVLRCLRNPLTYTFFMDEAAYDTLCKGSYFDAIGIIEMAWLLVLIPCTIGWKELSHKIPIRSLTIVFNLVLGFLNALLPLYAFAIISTTLLALKIKHPAIPTFVLIAIFDLLQACSA